MTRYIGAVASICFSSFLLPSGALAQSDEIRIAANLTTIIEATVSSIALINDRAPNSTVSDFAWSSSFNSSHWSFEGAGNINRDYLAFNMQGHLWGSGDNESFGVTYSGFGGLGEEAIYITGRTDWIYDPEVSDYTRMDFRQVTKFGDNSWWGYVVGGEVIFGGAIGAGSAIAGAAAATGGLALGVSAWIGAGGALAGSSALVSLSDTVQSLVETDEAPATPSPPARPPLPQPDEELLPRTGSTLTAIAQDGRMFGSGPDGIYALSGTFSLSDGTASGSIIEASSLR